MPVAVFNDYFVIQVTIPRVNPRLNRANPCIFHSKAISLNHYIVNRQSNMSKFSIIIYSVIIYLVTYSSFEPSDIITKIDNTTGTLVLQQYYKDYEKPAHHGEKCAFLQNTIDKKTLLADYYSEFSNF